MRAPAHFFGTLYCRPYTRQRVRGREIWLVLTLVALTRAGRERQYLRVRYGISARRQEHETRRRLPDRGGGGCVCDAGRRGDGSAGKRNRRGHQGHERGGIAGG